MDMIWFIAGLVVGAAVGVLVGYCAACLSILHKASVNEWEIEQKQECDDESH